MSVLPCRRFTGVPAILILACFVLALVAAPGVASAGAWKGQIVDKGGVSQVVNPAEPMEAPLKVTLNEIWRLGGESDDEEEFFGVISRITTDAKGNVYVLDSQLHEVKIYDKEGVFLRSIGREGEGPGEFRGPIDMFFTPDGNIGVMQIAPGRIVQLTPDGKPAGEHPLPTDEGGTTPFLLGGRRMGGNLALAAMSNRFDQGKFEQTRYIALIDKAGKEVKRLHSDVRGIDFANPVIDEKAWDTFDRRWVVGPDDRLYACTNHDDYEIRIWKSDGTPDKVITRPYAHLARTAEYKERIKGIYEAFTRQIPNVTVKVYDTHKDIDTIYPRNDGSLWVLTSRGQVERPKGALGVFDVFNKAGHFVRQVTLVGEGNPEEDAYFFVDDRVYVVTNFLSAAMAAQGGADAKTDEADAAPMEVICYKLDVPAMGM